MVRLRRDLPDDEVKAGELGTVVHVYEGGAAYEVEFPEGRSLPCLITLMAKDVEIAG